MKVYVLHDYMFKYPVAVASSKDMAMKLAIAERRLVGTDYGHLEWEEDISSKIVSTKTGRVFFTVFIMDLDKTYSLISMEG